ncbi:MAG: JAB domain-containing protein, partial [Candidatus Omnitrophota bacterium]
MKKKISINIDKPSYLGHRRRIKEKYRSAGLTGWLDYEVLELILSYAIPRKDTKPIAKRLLTRFKTIDGVFNASCGELSEVRGVSEHTALFIRLLKDITARYLESGLYNKDLISSPGSVYKYLKAYLKGAADEEFVVLFLNSGNFLLGVETVQKGTIDRAAVYPRKIVERALTN